jgi:hypothetical protein
LYGSTTVSETLGDGTTLNVIMIPENDYIEMIKKIIWGLTIRVFFANL